jgi:two-component system, OmpR family, sensor kinase
MFQSLRTRLVLLFASTLLLATAIAAAASIRLYQSYNRDNTADQLEGQVEWAASYYQRSFERYLTGQVRRTPVKPAELEGLAGSEVYYAGPKPFPGLPPGFRQLGADVPIDFRTLRPGEQRVFRFTTNDGESEYVGAAAPIIVDTQAIGAVVMAKRLDDINNAWTQVLGRVAAGTGVGLLVAFVLATIFSRRITRPLRHIGDAADRVAHGDLDVNVIDARTSDDELGTLATRFQDMVDRLREVDELERNFLMRISHELRTPITAISGHVQALTEGLVEPEELDDSLGAVNEEVRRLDRLVGDLLDLARLEAHRFRLVREEVGLEALLDQAAAAFREKARANEISFVTATEGAPTIITDGDRVLQIVNNLLDNAFRWTPRGGEVELAFDADRGGGVSIQVADTGPGIAKTDQDAVFHPFYSRRGEGGTGLGLSIARELANALGGRLYVESEPGAGATFVLALPRESRDGRPGAARPQAAVSGDGAARTRRPASA